MCAAVCVASNAAAVIALLLCNSNFIMLQNTKGPNAKKGRMSRLMDVGMRFRRSLMAKQALPTTPFRFKDSIKSRAAAYCDAAVAFAIRRQLYRVALGFRPHENKASSQRDFPMPGRAEPHCWQARDPRDPRRGAQKENVLGVYGGKGGLKC